MDVLRAAIVDDEPLARGLLRRMLDGLRDVDIVIDTGDAALAVREIREQRPDVVFLDIQMPGLSGPDVVRALGADAPAIVFVTAYDRYAIEAFELRAVDYLLKPFDETRLSETLARLRAAPGRALPLSDMEGLFQRLQQRERGSRRIFLTAGDRHVIRQLDDIDWIEADRKVLTVQCHGKAYTTPGPLSAIEAHLDRHRFVRVSRSTIINLDRVVDVQNWFGGDLVLTMADGHRVTTSRGYRARLDSVLGRVPKRDRG